MVVERKEQAAPYFSEVYKGELFWLKPGFLGSVISRDEAVERFRPFEGKSHQEIVKLAQEGGVLAAEWVYAYFHDRVVDYAIPRVGNVTLAADLASDTMSKVVSNIGNYRKLDDVPFSSWVFRIAHNHIATHFRRQAMINNVVRSFEGLPEGNSSAFKGSTMGPEEGIVRGIEFTELLTEIDELPEAQRQVMRMRFVEGASVGRTASILEKSRGNVKVLQHKAIARLRAFHNVDQETSLAQGTEDDLIKIFKQGRKKYYSGPELAFRLGISHDGVQYLVNKLRRQGVSIGSRVRYGYFLGAN